jgi:hypothetical protein
LSGGGRIGHDGGMDRSALTEYFTAAIREAYPRRISLNTREVAKVLTMCGRECAAEQARRLLDAGALGQGLRPTAGGWLVPIPVLAAGLATMMTVAPASAPATRPIRVPPPAPPLPMPDGRRGRPTRTLAFALAGGPELSDPPAGRRLFVFVPAPPVREIKPSPPLVAFVDRLLADLHALEQSQTLATVRAERAALFAHMGEVPPAEPVRWKRKPGVRDGIL